MELLWAHWQNLLSNMWQGGACSLSVTLFKTVNQVSWCSWWFSVVFYTTKELCSFLVIQPSPVSYKWHLKDGKSVSSSITTIFGFLLTHSNKFWDTEIKPSLSTCGFLSPQPTSQTFSLQSHWNINNSSPLNHRYSFPIYSSSCKHTFCFNAKQLHPTHLISMTTVPQTCL